MKKCSKCGVEKDFSEFCKHKKTKDGLSSYCKSCQKQYQDENKDKYKGRYKHYSKKYYEENKERIGIYNKEYWENNKEKNKIRNKVWRESNKEKYKDVQKKWYTNNRNHLNDYYNQKRKTDPLFKMSQNLSNNVIRVFKKKGFSKDCKIVDIVGGSWKVCREHIEKQFTKGMNWDNYGKWHIDHIIPLSSAKTKGELIKICHYSNLQPLWAKDNLSKGSKIL